MDVSRLLLASVGRWLRSVRPERAHLRADIVAGLPDAISSVPDGMAAAVLAGVNPVQGLYASFAGPVVGGLSSNTRMMVITTTSAAALAAGSALQSVTPAQRPQAVSLLVILAGIALVAAGIARLGRYTRFVSYSVMIGFLTGISVNIFCGQIADLTGASTHGAFPLGQGGQRADPSEQHQSGVAAGRAERARDLGGTGPDSPCGGKRADRPGDPHRGGGAGRCGQCGRGRGPGRHPARHPAPASARHQALVVQPGHWRARDGRHRPGPGRRGRRVRTQPWR